MNTAASSTAPSAKIFQFVGGELCLDFCNTVGGKRGARVREYINSYGDFLSWCEQAGLLERRDSKTRVDHAGQDPREAMEVHHRGIELREAIYRIFFNVFLGKKPATKDLTTLNNELGRSLNRLAVVPLDEGFAWQWKKSEQALDDPLGPIARSAAELLTDPASLKNLRQCYGDNCGWLFIDSSKNHSRCWCDMRDCGNRAKVRRYRNKKSKPSRRNPTPSSADTE